MAFFSCDVDRELVNKAVLPLYPGKLNEWIITFASPASDAEIRRSIGLFWAFAGIPMSTAGVAPDVRDLELVSWRVGPPASLPASRATLPIGREHLPPDYIYAVIRFVYAGTLQSLSPWPWKSRGFIIQCPEDVIAGVLAAMAPTDPPPEPKEPPGAIEQVAQSLSTATKTLLWGGVAVLLLQLYRATK